MWSSVASRQLASHPELPVPILLWAVKGARRMRLRFDERAQLVKLTHPHGVRPATALAWAASQKGWIADQIEKALPAEPLVPGAIIPVEGREVELAWAKDAPRAPILTGSRLVCGGPAQAFPRRIEQFLKRRAIEALSRESAEMAAAAGLRAVAVSVGDARTRWGSCSSSGRIRYSWRLILAPPEARRYVVAHEVAHLQHLDHGAGFKALERTLFGGSTRSAEASLRAAAPRLRRIGFAR